MAIRSIRVAANSLLAQTQRQRQDTKKIAGTVSEAFYAIQENLDQLVAQITTLQAAAAAIANNPVAAPSIGGVRLKTAGYTALPSDNGYLIAFNSASAVTLLLPASVPATPPSSQWLILVENINTGLVTIDPASHTLDLSSSPITLSQGQGVYITTDGQNYFTERGVGANATGATSPYLWEVPGRKGTATLTLSFVPANCAVSGLPDLALFRNGVLCTQFDPTSTGYKTPSGTASQRGYSISSATITLQSAFVSDDEFDAHYIPTTPVGPLPFPPFVAEYRILTQPSFASVT